MRWTDCDVRVTIRWGFVLLGRFADGLGLGEALSAVVAPGGERAPVHRAGSDSTLYRTLRGLGPEAVQSLLAAVASVRGAVWERRGDTAGCCGGFGHRLDAGGGAL